MIVHDLTFYLICDIIVNGMGGLYLLLPFHSSGIVPLQNLENSEKSNEQSQYHRAD